MILKNKKILIIIGGIILLAILIILVLMINFTLKTVNLKKRTVEVAGLGQDVKDSVKKNNSGPTLDISNNAISPKSFVVEYPGKISLAIIANNEAHDLVFSGATTSLDKIHLEPSEIKKINLELPEPGTYTLNCVTPGHKEKGEVGEMIVNRLVHKSPEQAIEELKNEQVKIPGANMVIKNGLIEPNTLVVAKDAPVFLTFSSIDTQDHNIIFSDQTIKTEEIKITTGKNKSITFKAAKIGEFEFHCSIPGHEKESGKMIVK